jgi:hypothetical protein
LESMTLLFCVDCAGADTDAMMESMSSMEKGTRGLGVTVLGAAG